VNFGSQNNSFSTVTAPRAGRPWFDCRQWWGMDFWSPHPDRFWDPRSLLSNAYRLSFPGGIEAWAWSWPLTSF